MAKILKIKEGYVVRNIIDEWIVVPVGESTAHETSVMSLNESGYDMWVSLELGATEADLLAKMLEEYDIDEATAAADIAIFLNELGARGILEEH